MDYETYVVENRSGRTDCVEKHDGLVVALVAWESKAQSLPYNSRARAVLRSRQGAELIWIESGDAGYVAGPLAEAYLPERDSEEINAPRKVVEVIRRAVDAE